MLSRLVALSIQFRGVVVAVACVVLGFGIYTTQHAKFDVYPEFAPPQVVIQTEAPGLASSDVETLVTRPVEYALNGTPNLTSIRSQSIQGLSVVTVVFEDKTDIYRARQMVTERISEAANQMPQGVQPPAMAPLVGATSLTLVVGLTSETRSAMELRTFADWTLRPRLLGVPGVARVSTFGGDVRELQIQANPDRMAAFHVAMNELVTAARGATGVRGAGFVETAAQRIVLETSGQSLTPAQLGEVVLATNKGRAVRLKDVALTAEAPEPKIGDATIMGNAGVLLLVSAQYGANTLEVTSAIERALDELKPAFESARIRLYPDIFRPANFVVAAIHNINTALLLGAVLVAVVLLLFLFNLRVAFISLTAIPLSLLIAIILLDRFGLSLNTLTLGGLAIAIGEVVDDAIIDSENIFRRLREAPKPFRAGDLFRIVHDASIEVRSAIVYATFIVALVFVPVLSMSGIQGRLFAPLAWSYILAILASLAVALTVTPALCYMLLPKAAQSAAETRFVSRLKTVYQRVLRSLAGRTGLVIAATVAICAIAACAIPFLGGEFLPEMREGHFIVHVSSLPGASLEESVRLGKLITAELVKNKEVRLVAQQIGRAERADDTWGVHYSEFHVDLKPTDEAPEEAEAEIRDAVARFPGVSVSINPFLTERMEEIISGLTADVVLYLFGEDLDVLDRKAREIAATLKSVPGAADVQVESPPGTPQIAIRLRPERMLQFGFQPVNVLDAVQAAYQGAVVGQVYDGAKVFNVTAILEPRSRNKPDQVGSLVLQNMDGLRVPLREVASIYETSGRHSIAHSGTRRRQAVTCNVKGRDLTSFVGDARRRVNQNVRLPPGFYLNFSGASEAREQARSEILTSSLVAAAGILILLSIVFYNLQNTLLVLANLPFAMVGGVMAAFAAGGQLSVGSMVGFVTLFGITTRNSIMMISHFEHLVEHEGEPWGLEAAIRGASERLTPVLMTAIVTGLGLLPLAIGSEKAGREIEGPMAIVILGGLATSTLLNLLVLPGLALKFGRFAPTAER